MAKLPRIVAWVCVVNGVLTLLALVVPYFVKGQLPPVPAIAIWSALGIASLIGGYFALKAKPWAFWLLAVMFVVQVAEYWSPEFFFSFIGPVAIKVGWGWYSPPSRINVNLLAIVGAILAFVCARGLTTRSTGPAGTGLLLGDRRWRRAG